MKVVTSWLTLFQLAKEVGDARKSGDPERLAEAERRHKEYEHMCLEADEMIHMPKIRD